MKAIIHKIILAIADAVGTAEIRQGKKFDSVAYRIAIPNSAEQQKSSRILLLAAMIMLLASFLAIANPARAQTVTALQDTTCDGYREGSAPNCTAGEFTTGATIQNGPGSPTECLAGQSIVVNIALSMSGSNADRQDIGFFVGQQQNDPRATTPGNICSVATFPNGPLPWKNNDSDSCGDFTARGSATPVVQNVKILCQGNPGTGRVTVPYLLTYWQNNGNICAGPGNVVGGNSSKCNYSAASEISIGINDFMMVYGSVTLTKKTEPAGESQSFNFTASGDVTTCSGTPTPTSCPGKIAAANSSFSLQDNQSQTVKMVVGSANHVLTITEAATAGWDSTATITCSGGVSVTTNNATRTIQATLNTANPHATCTITNKAISDMAPTFGPLLAAFGPGETVNNLMLTCTNSSAGPAVGATCVPSVSAGTISNLSCNPSTPAHVAGGASITCTFNYTAPDAAGGSDTPAQTVIFTGTTGATNDINSSNNTFTSTARPIIDALKDTLGPINGGTGGSTTSVLANDTNGAVGATTANVTITNLSGGTFPSGGSALIVNTTTGLITVPAGATPGAYTVPYQICANLATNPAACDNAVATVTVQGSDMQPSFTGGGLPTTIGPGQTITVTGGLTCTNNGPGSATSPTCTTSTTTSGATVSTANCTSPTLPLAAGGAIVCDLVITASGSPGGGDVTATSVAVAGSTSATNDTSSGNNSTSGSINLIDAVDDPNLGPINSATGGNTTSVLANDTRGVAGATIANVTVSANGAQSCTPSGSGACTTLTLNADGTITVPANATPGAYTVPYQICANPATNPAACDTAAATITVVSINAQDDLFTVSPDVSTNVTTPTSVVATDTVNGVSVTLGTNATLTVSGTAHDGTTALGLTSTPPAQGSITMNADGAITVGPNTSQGTYTYKYEICALPATTPPVCAIATATIKVNATVPITLASVTSRQNPSGLTVTWTTATETRNAGFHLYGRKAGESAWQRLTTALIPSNVIDALEPQRYTASFPRVQVDELLVEDWDTQGQTQRHGPFAVGRQHGFDAVAAAQPINWTAIHAENTETVRQAKAQLRTIMAAGVPDALLWVTQPGVQRVTFNELQAAGANFSGVAIADLALTDAGASTPRYVIDANNNGQFDSGDTLEFLSQVNPTLYSARNAYRLVVDRSRVSSADSQSLDPQGAASSVFDHTIQVERQLVYSSSAPGNDPWYDQRLFAYTSLVSLARTFDLPGYAGGDARLNLRLWGVTDWPGAAPDHHLVVKVNGQKVDEAWFDGSVDASRTLTLPAVGLKATGNTLTLEAPGDTGYAYDIQALDGFTVQYGRYTQADSGAWQGALPADAKVLITGFQGESVAWQNAQRRVGGGQLIVSGSGSWVAADSRAIRRPTIQADVPTPAAAPTAAAVDYLIISHPLFRNSAPLNDLVALQQSRGYRTAVVNVDTIYAAHADFEVSAEAISRYIQQAQPRFVLLVGGDSYDYQNYLGLASQSFIPTHYAATVAPVTYAPADSRYVEYNNDGRPQAALGRLPVRTVAELTQVVAKLVNYVPPTHAVLGAGPSDGGSRQFALISEGYAAQLPASWTRQLVAVDDLGLAPAKTALQTELNLSGALVSYMGHSSYAIWGLNPTSGILLSATEARQVTNPTPHLITQWGCWNTYFVNPKQDTMASAFLFQARGAAAVVGATALSDVSVLTGLGKVFFSQLGQSATLGEALQAAEQAYLNQNPAAAGKLRGFALLGDPAAPVR